MQSLTDENEFDLHENETLSGAHFHVNAFVRILFDIKTRANSEMDL